MEDAIGSSGTSANPSCGPHVCSHVYTQLISHGFPENSMNPWIRKSSRSIIIVLTVILTGLVVSMPQAVRAASSFGLDGVGTNNCQGQFCVHSQLLTTTMGGDVVILIVDCNGCSKLSVTDSTGLTFSQRLAYATGDRLWEFYAIAASPLTSDNITVLPDSSDTGAVFKGMQTFAIHGANTSAVFDPNPSMPATASYTRDNCGVGYGMCSVSVQTSSVDFLVGSTAIDDAGPCGQTYQHGSVPGFTNLTNQNNRFEVDYAVTTTSQSNVVFDCNGTDASSIVVDAISSTEHSPILINGNDGFTSTNGVTGGTGTSNDPYVISGWTISAENYGIQISGTTAYFTITNVAISCDPTNADCWGIMFSSVENGVVQNSHLSGPRGIGVHNSDNFQVTENNLSPGETGIGLWDSSSFDVSNNVVYGGGDDTVFLWNVTNFDLSGNSIHSGEVVIFLGFASSFDISNNSLEGGTFAINGDHVSDASIVGNTGGAEDGIVLSNFSGLLISQNIIVGHVSIGVQDCGDSTIDGNTANAHDYGIFVGACGNILVSNNNASNITNGQGIYLDNSDNVTITSNTLSNNLEGIRLVDYATGNSITNNAISNNQCGIRTDSTSTPDQNYLADNTFTGNTQDYCGF